ncbi:MAG TPA: hypothetical protein EYP56_12720 [Planctomycetaceae bacterium]|nr:hypothetical protein [Planctomycetaceae bacterium]
MDPAVGPPVSSPCVGRGDGATLPPCGPRYGYRRVCEMAWTLLAICLGVPIAGPDTVVVCPPEFRRALEPWLEHRAGQGHRMALVSNGRTPELIRRRIAQVAETGGLRFVVLVGDADPGMAFDPRKARRSVPVHWAQARVNVRWGSEPHIATDNWYGDLDGDGVPELAVGRLTADSAEELAVMVSKIIAYERSPDFGPWRRRINVVAGLGGFGPLIDAGLEAAGRFLLTQGIPAEYQVSMTYANWRSPYCPNLRTFAQTVLARLNEGCRFWVYLGHGYHLALDEVRVPGARYAILSVDDLDRVACRHGMPIALFFACYTGAFDARQDCLAERLLATPAAPVAVIAASRVTMPYGMAVLGSELMAACFDRRTETLGEALLEAKQQLARPGAANGLGRAALDAVAALISGDASQLAAERAEHVLLFNLIGDPLLRLAHPKPVPLELDGAPRPGSVLEVSGWSPLAGRVTVELVVRRDRLTFTPPVRGEYPGPLDQQESFQQVYRMANDRRLAGCELTTGVGRFTARLPVPEEVGGPCHLRVYVQGADGCAAGSVAIQWAEKPGPKRAMVGGRHEDRGPSAPTPRVSARHRPGPPRSDGPR